MYLATLIVLLSHIGYGSHVDKPSKAISARRFTEALAQTPPELQSALETCEDEELPQGNQLLVPVSAAAREQKSSVAQGGFSALTSSNQHIGHTELVPALQLLQQLDASSKDKSKTLGA
jgi:hypothetical protein